MSFSLENEDCSWYAHCDMDNLASTGAKYKSSAIHPQPGDAKSPASKGLYVMPYIKGGKRGVLLVNKRNNDIAVNIAGVTGGVATVVEATGARQTRPSYP